VFGDLFIDFFSVHVHVLRGLDSEPNLLSANLEDDDLDLISYYDALMYLSGEY
jgi:hypothetical protein